MSPVIIIQVYTPCFIGKNLPTVHSAPVDTSSSLRVYTIILLYKYVLCVRFAYSPYRDAQISQLRTKYTRNEIITCT